MATELSRSRHVCHRLTVSSTTCERTELPMERTRHCRAQGPLFFLLSFAKKSTFLKNKHEKFTDGRVYCWVMTSIQPAVRLSDRTAAFIQRPRSIQRHRGPRTHERHLSGMVPHSRRGEGVEKFIQNIGTRACSFPSTSSLSRVRSSLYSPSSRLHRPVIPPPNPSHPVAMAPS